ncbi:MAG: hypothetical protein SGARI_006725 [Bacillariaceae sp.]
MTRLWKYLVLYIYGGVYTSLDFVPTQQFLIMDWNDQDAVIALQKDRGAIAENKFSSQFLVASPRHPLVFFALHHALQDLARGDEMGDELQKAFLDFQAGDASGNIVAASFKGVEDRAVTVIDLDGENQMVKHGEGILSAEKKTQQKAAVSCRESILMEVLDAATVV